MERKRFWNREFICLAYLGIHLVTTIVFFILFALKIAALSRSPGAYTEWWPLQALWFVFLTIYFTGFFIWQFFLWRSFIRQGKHSRYGQAGVFILGILPSLVFYGYYLFQLWNNT